MKEKTEEKKISESIDGKAMESIIISMESILI